jgi:hypothetical protein
MEQFGGVDRRVNKVYVTRNTEYHVREGVCVAVRDRQSGTWVREHAAIRTKLEGGVRVDDRGVSVNIGKPLLGDAVYFRKGNHDVVTSRLVAVERPAKQIVLEHYLPAA